MALRAPANSENPNLGIAMMLGAYFLFSLVDTSVKWLLYAGLASFQLAFMRYASHFIISIFFKIKISIFVIRSFINYL